MLAASAAEEFEQATLERNRLRAVHSLLERRRVANESVGTLDAVAVLAGVARSAVRRGWTLADALVARDGAAATRVYLQLRAQGERPESLSYWMTRRLREALAVSLQLEAGSPTATVRASLRMPPKAAAAFVSDVQRSEPSVLRRALALLADLEIDSRGRSPLDPDTLALRTIERAAA